MGDFEDKIERKEVIKALTNKPTDAELKIYEEDVVNVAENGADFVFRNDNHYHAAIVIKNILTYAQDEILIFDGNLSNDIAGKSEDFLAVLKACVQVEGKIVKIAVEDRLEDGIESPIEELLRELCAEYPKNVVVKLTDEAFLQGISDARKKLGIKERVHFTVGDRSMYRIELPLNSRKAFCNFGSTNIAKCFAKAFDAGFDNCRNYFNKKVSDASVTA
jgi:hypothetical protein